MLVLLVAAAGIGLFALLRPHGGEETKLRIVTTALPEAVLGHAYPQRLMAAGGAPPYSWSLKRGDAGLVISADGAITGLPAVSGRFRFEVEVRDRAKRRESVSLELTIIETGTSSPLRLTTKVLPPAMKGRTFALTFAAEGGAPPYSWAVSGLPDGLTAEGADISGVAAVAGIFELAVSVSDGVGARVGANLDLQVVDKCGPPSPGLAAPLQANLLVPPMIEGRAFEVQLCASGGSPPYQWKPLTFAPGVTLNGNGRLRVENPQQIPSGWSMQGKVFDAAGLAAVGGIYPRLVRVPGTPTAVLSTLALLTACIVIVLLLRLSLDARALKARAGWAPWVMRGATVCGVLGVATVMGQWVVGFWVFVVCSLVLAFVFLGSGSE
jgi:hypothetical protein